MPVPSNAPVTASRRRRRGVLLSSCRQKRKASLPCPRQFARSRLDQSAAMSFTHRSQLLNEFLHLRDLVVDAEHRYSAGRLHEAAARRRVVLDRGSRWSRALATSKKSTRTRDLRRITPLSRGAQTACGARAGKKGIQMDVTCSTLKRSDWHATVILNYLATPLAPVVNLAQ